MGKKAGKKDRELDFSAYPTRHIVLRVAYHGQDMDGLARQENTTNTVEHFVIHALRQVRLIPPLLDTNGNPVDEKADAGKALMASPAKFSRCGRTDKGVSALGNAMSLLVRGAKEGQEDLQYSNMLNRVLPAEVRIVAWAYVPDTFDARFSCISRTYRYFFATEGRDLGRMQQAAAKLLGEHDFRNLCKMDVVNVSNFVRTIYSADLFDAVTESPVTDSTTASVAPPVAFIQIRGSAFLYHQIRCIMTVLFLVAEEKEDPSVVDALLDIATHPGKPCYPLADERNLVLWDCSFDEEVVRWRVDHGAFCAVLTELTSRSAAMHVAAAISDNMRRALRQKFGRLYDESAVPERGPRYQPLLSRPTEHTYEQKVAGLSDAKAHRREANRAMPTGGRDRALQAEAAPDAAAEA